jgi:ribonuclease HII
MQSVDWLLEERLARESGRGIAAGIDEAGRGALAGPVVAACVVLPADFIPVGVNDSKQLNPAQRERCYTEIVQGAVAIGIGIVDEAEIDHINILKATHSAMRLALRKVEASVKVDIALIDGLPVKPFPVYQKAIVKGDGKCASIACASIIAKVTRDRLMTDLDKVYPLYGFASHKGYCTAHHVNAIKQFGACAAHRLTFEPIAGMILQGMPAPRQATFQGQLEL